MPCQPRGHLFSSPWFFRQPKRTGVSAAVILLRALQMLEEVFPKQHSLDQARRMQWFRVIGLQQKSNFWFHALPGAHLLFSRSLSFSNSNSQSFFSLFPGLGTAEFPPRHHHTFGEVFFSPPVLPRVAAWSGCPGPCQELIPVLALLFPPFPPSGADKQPRHPSLQDWQLCQAQGPTREFWWGVQTLL